MNVSKTNLQEASWPSAVADTIGNVSKFLSILAILGMLISVNIEVIGRSFFNYATIWVTEVSTYLVVTITFFGSAYVAVQNANVRVDLLLNRFPKRLQRVLLDALTWISVFMTLVVLWKFTEFWSENYLSGARSWSLLNTPQWVPQLSVVVGLFFLVLALVFKAGARAKRLALIPMVPALLLALLGGAGFLPAGWDIEQVTAGLIVLTIISAGLASGLPALVLSICITLPVAFLFFVTNDADLSIKSAALIGILLLLLLSGLPVVFSLLSIGIFSMLFWFALCQPWIYWRKNLGGGQQF